MKRSAHFLLELAFVASSGWAQTGNVVVGGGYSTPVPFPAAPGQVITLLVQGIGANLTQTIKAQGTPLPTTLGGISVTLRQTASVPSSVPAPTLAQTLLIDFDFRKNAAAQRVEEPTPDQPALLFAGLAPGFVGLYQINFRVPQVPNGLPKCSIPSGPAQILPVRSNMTVAISEMFSFDGAAICVDPGS